MDYSLYIHIPFCKRRCHYCDFNTYTHKESLITAYIDALIRELRIVSRYLKAISLRSIYFGGGTPSSVPYFEYERLMRTVSNHFSLQKSCEINLEANPGTLSKTYLEQLGELGVNRLSIGVQSTNPLDLNRLDRIHNIDDVLDSIRLARSAGFSNINLDMIFNLPWQDLASWQNSLSRAVDLAPEHFSLYSLIIEPGTSLYQWHQKGLIAPQNEDLEADMYELAMEKLQKAGYQHYEISNWSKCNAARDFRSKHNLQYWLNLPYIGVGAGAHGYLGEIRTENIATIDGYIKRMKEGFSLPYEFPKTPTTINALEVDRTTQMQDFMWLGLRLVSEGVSAHRFFSTYGCSMQEVFHKEIDALLARGLVEWGGVDGENLILTKRGVMLANQVFQQFV